MQKDEPNAPQKPEADDQAAPDMHSSKDHENVQGGQGGRSTDTDKNSEHDQNRERSIAGREDS